MISALHAGRNQQQGAWHSLIFIIINVFWHLLLDNQAAGSTPTKGSPATTRPKGSVIDLTEDDDDVQGKFTQTLIINFVECLFSS